MIDKDTIKRWWQVFVGDDSFTEVRILGRFQYSGYFKSIDNLIQAIEPYSNMDDEQIYFVLNRIDDACYGRQQSEKIVKSPKITTNDNDIIRRNWVMIDFDPIRKTGVNSTEEEFELAHKKAQHVFTFLRSNGFQEPVICKSGNGWHLQYKVDLLNDDDTTEIIKQFFSYLGSKFTDEFVDIDQKVFNKARLCKLYGTMAKKGANLADRPWRMSEIVYVPKDINTTPIEQFKMFADQAPKEEPKQLPNRNYYGGGQRFDLPTWLNEHGIVYREKKSGSSILYELESCPWIDSHSDRKKWDSALFVDAQGGIRFNCTHSHCKGKTWHDLRLFYEPDAYSKPQYQPQQYQRYVPQKPKYQIKDELPELGNKWLCMSDIKKVDLSQIESVKTGFFELDQKIVGLHMSEVTMLSGSNACVDCDTEYFNGTEWKKISEYQSGEKVLQYNADGSAELVIPQRYIKSPCNVLYLLQSVTGVDQCVSINHNLVYMTSKGNLAKKSVANFLAQHNASSSGFMGKFYTTFRYEQGDGIELNEWEIRLMCAIICDGHFQNNFKDKNVVRINIKKKRKKQRLERLLDMAHIEYRKEQYNPKDAEYNTYFFHAPRKENEFSSYWYSCTAEQLAIVADEILYWDGNISNKKRCNSSFTSINKKNIDFIQFAFASIGIRASIHIDDRVGRFHSGGKYMYKSICYKLVICSTRNPSLRNPKKKKTIPAYRPKDGYKYCFTVPSGMLVMRRNGNINITGNSGKSSWLNTLLLNIVQQGKKIALWSGELRSDILKTWIQMVAAGKENLTPSKINEGKYYVPNNIGEQIDQWLDGKFFIYNNEYGTKWEQIFNDMEELLKVGVKVFALDNLFSLDIDLFDGDKNNKQKELILQIKDFAKKNQVHIILVAHPRKVMTFLRKNDISGTSDLTNAVDNVFIIHRVNEDFLHAIREFFGSQNAARYESFGNVIAVEKNRMYGVADLMVGMYYERESRRFKNSEYENIVYSWKPTYTQVQIVEPQPIQPQQQVVNENFEFVQKNSAPF